jgi:hypothetical protein
MVFIFFSRYFERGKPPVRESKRFEYDKNVFQASESIDGGFGSISFDSFD